MSKKIIWSAGLLTTLALPMVTVVSCGGGGTTTYYFASDISKYDSQMISQLSTSVLTENVGSLAKGHHVSSEKLGLDVSIGDGLSEVFTVTKPLENGQISLDLYLTKDSKYSRTKNITIYANDTDAASVLEVSRAIKEISIITTTEVSAVTAETALTTSVLDDLVASGGKIFGSFPSDIKGTTIVYEVPEIKFDEEKSLIITVSKGEAKLFATIKVKVQTQETTNKEQQDIDDVQTAFGQITKITSEDEIVGITEPRSLSLALLAKYGEITGTAPTDLKGTTLTYIVDELKYEESGIFTIYINKGMGTEKTVEISIEVLAESTT